jgi:hypothetical protein
MAKIHHKEKKTSELPMAEGNRNQNISEFATALDLPAPQIDRRLTLRSMLEDMIGQGSHNNLGENG